MNYIIEKYMFLFEKISNTTKMSQSFDTDVNIYRSEIHIIQLIGDKQELYLSEIAKLLGVTKGTISEIIKRLESKGLLMKYIDVNNNTQKRVSLTEKGVTAYKAHVNYHNHKHKEMEYFLSTLNDEKRAVLEEFIDKASEMIEGHF